MFDTAGCVLCQRFLVSACYLVVLVSTYRKSGKGYFCSFILICFSASSEAKYVHLERTFVFGELSLRYLLSKFTTKAQVDYELAV